jgi:hypothetical protein
MLTLCVVVLQKGVSVAVDEELSAVLAASRFNKFFAFGDVVTDPQTNNPVRTLFCMFGGGGDGGGECNSGGDDDDDDDDDNDDDDDDGLIH